MITRNYSS